MPENQRDRGRLETNLLRSPLVDTNAREPAETPLTTRSLLGMGEVRVSRRLAVRDLAALAWASDRLMAQHKAKEAGRTGRIELTYTVSGTLYELGQTVYGREPGGEERRLLLASLDRLVDCSVDLPGYDATEGKYVGRLTGRSRANLLGAVYIEHERLGVTGPKDLGAIRGDNLKIEFAMWHAKQIRAGHVTYLDLSKFRSLGQGLAPRLWAYLEAESYKPSGEGYESSWVGLGRPALATFGIKQSRRPIDVRRALNRAGERIVKADDRYAQVGCERRAGGWALVAVRRGATALKAHRAVVASFEESESYKRRRGTPSD